jgi:predicted transcriptional regulator
MTAHQNLTIRLPKEVIDRVRVLAAERGSSMSALIVATIEALAAEGDTYEAAKRLALADLADGLSIGGGAYLSRDEAHGR